MIDDYDCRSVALSLCYMKKVGMLPQVKISSTYSIFFWSSKRKWACYNK